MFMIHPEHGATNAPEGEVSSYEKEGWKPATIEDWFRMNGKEHLCKPVEKTQQIEPAKKIGRPRKTT